MDTTCLTLPVSNTKPCLSAVAATRASAICHLQPVAEHHGFHQGRGPLFDGRGQRQDGSGALRQHGCQAG